MPPSPPPVYHCIVSHFACFCLRVSCFIFVALCWCGNRPAHCFCGGQCAVLSFSSPRVRVFLRTPVCLRTFGSSSGLPTRTWIFFICLTHIEHAESS